VNAFFRQFQRLATYPRKFIATFRWIDGLRYIAGHVLKKDSLCLRIRAHPAPVWIRPRTSDIRVAYEIFTAGEMRMPWPLSAPPASIIDGGANVGYASLVFHERWPDAHILAIEPDDSNSAILRRNLESLPRVDIKQLGIWGFRCHLQVTPETRGSTWGFQFTPVPPNVSGAVRAETIAGLIDLLPGRRCDLLKLDIEGAEKSVFGEEELDWADRVSVILVEAHGDEARQLVRKFATGRGFSISMAGEKMMLVRPNGRDLQPS
jgi:FkbM family methyltransferase